MAREGLSGARASLQGHAVSPRPWADALVALCGSLLQAPLVAQTARGGERRGDHIVREIKAGFLEETCSVTASPTRSGSMSRQNTPLGSRYTPQ